MFLAVLVSEQLVLVECCPRNRRRAIGLATNPLRVGINAAYAGRFHEHLSAAAQVARHHAGARPLDQLFRLLIEVAEADSNLTQLLRSHFAGVERLQAIPLPLSGKFLTDAGRDQGMSDESVNHRFGVEAPLAHSMARRRWEKLIFIVIE